MLDVQRKRDKVRKELANERRTFVIEEQERKVCRIKIKFK
jgi:hypothetical protein